MVRQPPRDAIKKTLKGRGSALTCKATHLERLNQNKIELETPPVKKEQRFDERRFKVSVSFLGGDSNPVPLTELNIEGFNWKHRF